MVNRIAFVPEKENIELLAGLEGPISIWAQARFPRASNSVVMKTNSGVQVRLTVHWKDLRFKFECFLLTIDRFLGRTDMEYLMVLSIRKWTKLECLFRAEWERPIPTREISKKGEQTIRKRGGSSQIPADSLIGGVSMVGLLFSDADSNPLALIVNSDDIPGTIEVISDPNHINAVLQECEQVETNNVQSWYTSLTGWTLKQD